MSLGNIRHEVCVSYLVLFSLRRAETALYLSHLFLRVRSTCALTVIIGIPYVLLTLVVSSL